VTLGVIPSRKLRLSATGPPQSFVGTRKSGLLLVLPVMTGGSLCTSVSRGTQNSALTNLDWLPLAEWNSGTLGVLGVKATAADTVRACGCGR
jgi:hypothetical protein